MTTPHPLDALTKAEKAEIDALPPLERARARLTQKKFEVSRAEQRTMFADHRPAPPSQFAQASALYHDALALRSSQQAVDVSAVNPQVATRLAQVQKRAKALMEDLVASATADRPEPPPPATRPARPATSGTVTGGGMEWIDPEKFKRQVSLMRRKSHLKRKTTKHVYDELQKRKADRTRQAHPLPGPQRTVTRPLLGSVALPSVPVDCRPEPESTHQ